MTHTPPTQSELDADRKLCEMSTPWERDRIKRLITEVERLRAKNTSENLNGNWMDKWGACRICGGEIPHGHTNACDYYRLTKEVEELEQLLAKAIHFIDPKCLSKEGWYHSNRTMAEHLRAELDKLKGKS